MKFKERDTSKPAEQQGIFRKFQVSRVDGSDVVGGKHFGCRYFVLDMDHDAHAPAALRAYADSCASTHPELAADLRREFGEAERTTSPVSQMTDGQIDDLLLANMPITDPRKFVRAILAAAAPHAPQTVAEGELPPLPVDLDYLIEYIAQPAVREALRNQISAYARAAIAASQPPQDERAAFEVWAASRLASIHRHKAAGHDLNGSYISVSTQAAWEAWQARAAMAKGGAANCQDNEGEKA